MPIFLQAPDIRELKPRITVFGVGGAGGNAVNNMIESGLLGCEFVVADTDAQALTSSKAERVIQMGLNVTQGLGAGSHPEVGSAATDEVIDEIRDQLSGAHMCFITAGMGGGTGTGAAPVIARTARDMGILTVGVVTKPFQFEGSRRMRTAEAGIQDLQAAVDTLIVIPNQNLFRVANEKTTFAMADQVLCSGVACITDLMVKEGLINLDFADVRAIMRGMGKAMMGTGEASGEKRANRAAEAAIANPLLDDVSMKGARGLLISITGGSDLTLYDLDGVITRIREEIDQDAEIILGATFDESLDSIIRVSVVAIGIEPALISAHSPNNPAVAERLRAEMSARAASPVLSIPTEATAPVTRDRVILKRVQPGAAAPSVPAPAPPQSEPATQLPADPFVPQRPPAAAGTPLARDPRIPQTPEPPRIARLQIEADRAAEEAAPNSKRTSLLRRLAAVGFGARRDEINGTALPPRLAPRARMMMDDDQLEIPAFLRRQANGSHTSPADASPTEAAAPPHEPGLQDQAESAHIAPPAAAQPQIAQPPVPPAPVPSFPQDRPDQSNLDADVRRLPQSGLSDVECESLPPNKGRQTHLRNLEHLYQDNFFRGMQSTKENSSLFSVRDDVKSAVFCPSKVNLGETFLVQICFYREEQEQKAHNIAKMADVEAVQKGEFSFPLDIPMGTFVDVHLELGSLRIKEPDETICWRGQPSILQYEVHVPSTYNQSRVVGKVSFSISGIPVGTLKFVIEIDRQIKTEVQPVQQELEVKRYRRAFVSYSSRDRSEVLRRIQAFKIAGIDIFQDILSLSPGERWEKGLFKEIDRCDVFLLFWSKSASMSEWVAKEIEYALSVNLGKEDNIPVIQPIPIEGPPIAPPPDLLAHLHFNDALLAYIHLPKISQETDGVPFGQAAQPLIIDGDQ